MIRKLKDLFGTRYKSEIKEYVGNQQIIMMKLDYIAERQGIQWPVHILNHTRESSTEDKGRFYMFFSAASFHVRFVLKKGKQLFINLLRRKINMHKLKSRKFWMSVIAALLVIANEGLDLGIDTETVMAFAAIVIGYIFGESAVDAVRAKKEKKDQVGDHGPAVSEGEVYEEH